VNPLALEKLERIARNLPALKINFGRAATKYGDVFMAWGRNVDAWHAVYGTDLHGGLARGLSKSSPRHARKTCSRSFSIWGVWT